MDPAAMILSTTLIDAGEKITLEPLETVEITCLARLIDTEFCSDIDSRTSIFAGREDLSTDLLGNKKRETIEIFIFDSLSIINYLIIYCKIGNKKRLRYLFSNNFL